MPFTISHAAAVLPFARPLARWRLLSATVIGSMVPDFGFLMPWRPARIETHSAWGLLEFCLPVGLATFWIFQQLVKTPIVAILPDAPYARWRAFAEPARIGSLEQWAFAALGVLAGAVTHLVWDGFTHEGARGVRMIPVLDDPVDIAGHRLAGARLLQDGSSLIGLVIVIAIVAYALRTDGTQTVPERSLRPEAQPPSGFRLPLFGWAGGRLRGRRPDHVFALVAARRNCFGLRSGGLSARQRLGTR
jgi:hypothetical protein